MKKKRILPVLAALTLLLVISSTALAVSKNTSIAVTFNGIKLMIDGKLFTPKDAQGNIVEPFSYNGTTYVPIRAVGEAFGKEVSWDSATGTVVVGGKTVQNLDEMGAYQFDSSTNSSKYNSAGENRIDGIAFKRGVLIFHSAGDYIDVGTTEVTKLSYLLSKEFITFYTTFDVTNEHCMDPTILKIYGDSKLLYTSPAFTYNSKALSIELDVSSVSVLTFECESKSNYVGGTERSILLGDARLVK